MIGTRPQATLQSLLKSTEGNLKYHTFLYNNERYEEIALTFLQHIFFQDNDTTALAPHPNHHHQALHHNVQARAKLPHPRGRRERGGGHLGRAHRGSDQQGRREDIRN